MNRLKQEISLWVRNCVLDLFSQKLIPEHRNLIQYYDSTILFENDKVRGVIITEHCDGGLLSDVVTQNYPQTFSEKLILAILRDLCCALYTLHTEDPPISHRNVNVFFCRVSEQQPNYIYVDSSGRCKLEAARSMTSNMIVCAAYLLITQTPKSLEEAQVVQQQLELVSDPAYFPPEFCDLQVNILYKRIRSNPSKQRKITEKVDVWELGILMYYLAFYSTPFESVDGKTDTKSLLLGRFTYPANDARNFSREFLDLVKSMLTADVTKYMIPVGIILQTTFYN